MLKPLNAITPIDGRYRSTTHPLSTVFSEYGLISARVKIELLWLISLSENNDIKEIKKFNNTSKKHIDNIIINFDDADAEAIKLIEKTTNHDVKAVEYFVKDKLKTLVELDEAREFVHFACTSEDINNLSHALMLSEGRKILLKYMDDIIEKFVEFANEWAGQPMLSRTHGQSATPTTVGKEFANFAKRLTQQRDQFESIKIFGKINGAVGNFNAHDVAYPDVDWLQHAKNFVESLGLNWNKYTTQIEPHDYISEIFHSLVRFNNILIDFNRDIWTYISLGYFKQKKIKGEVGSSTMPHKINPIDFENSEGNLGVGNAVMNHMADKLPISRLQRDLTDSTVLRNMGVGFSYSLISYNSTLKGLSKLQINKESIDNDIDQAWEILAEPLQTIMRRYGIENPYEKLKDLTQGRSINANNLHEFIKGLDLSDDVKNDLIKMKPRDYLGYAEKLAKEIK